MDKLFPENDTPRGIVINIFIAFFSLFLNGFGVYLTIHANIGSAPWDVLNLGLSHTFGILYGTASIIVSFLVLGVDIAMKEKIGITMIIDALTVGKAVDFFEWLSFVPMPKNIVGSIIMSFVGMVVLGYTRYFYMRASLGCGPRDTLMVGIARHSKKLSVGAVSGIMQCVVTLIGWLLGGPVGVGTVICALCSGPIMDVAFKTVKFDATGITHQNIIESFEIFGKKEENTMTTNEYIEKEKNDFLIKMGKYEKVYSKYASPDFPFTEKNEETGEIRYYKKVPIEISEEDFQKLLKSGKDEKEKKENKPKPAVPVTNEEAEEKASNTAKIAKAVKIVGIILILIAFGVLAFLFVDDTFTDAATTSVSSISDIFVGGVFLFVLGEILLILDDIKHRK